MISLRKSRRVTCNNCGFIGVIHLSPTEDNLLQDLIKGRTSFSEIPPVGREHLNRFAFPEPFLVRCNRGQVSWVVNSSATPEPGLGDRNSISASLRVEKECPYFYKYCPGYNPNEHRELQRESAERKFTLKVAIMSGLIGATIGGLVAAIVNLITKA